MKTNIHLLAAGLLLSAFSLQPSALHAQGALTPPGAPAPTMKTLAQIEPRTPIASVPFTITNSGSYYLTSNLDLTVDANAITIAANEVTLDLNGFTISTSVLRGTGAGILLNGDNTDITIFNGHITGGNFQYLGNGLTYSGSSPVNVHVAHVSVTGCGSFGINLGTNYSASVEACAVQNISGYGIEAGLINRSTAQAVNTAIIASSAASDCVGASSEGNGVSVNGTANNCSGSSYSGTGLSASTANNCSGTSSTGIGLNASKAFNCQGTSSSYHGLLADAALNCFGTSDSHYAMYASIALNCIGYSGSDVGLSADMAQNCYGTSYSSTGLSAYTAQNCYGRSSTGTGLFAFLANGCLGRSSTGTPLSASHNVNSFAY